MGDCFGCYDTSGYRCRHETTFRDSRTGYEFCHECIEALVSWEMDGCPDDAGDSMYWAWLDADVVIWTEVEG